MYEVYSKPGCTYCDQAKALLVQKGIPYVEKVLDVGQPKTPGVEYYHKEDLLAVVPAAKTLPQIVYIADTLHEATTIIGGFTDLVGYLKDQEENAKYDFATEASSD